MSDEPLGSAGDGENGRLHDGTFAPGNKFGRGNPHQKAAQSLRACYFKVFDEAGMTETVKKHLELCKSGDLEAIKLAYAYAWGKPDSIVQLTGAEGGPVLMGSVTMEQSAQEISAWRKQMTAELLAMVPPDETDDTP